MPARTIFLAVILCLSAAFPGAAAGEKTFTFGVCAMAMRHTYFQDMVDEIKKEAAKEGVQIIAGDADFDLDRQIGIIEDFISRKVSLIMLAPCDSARIVPVLEKAKAAGIPVMTVDVAAQWKGSISHCASDNVAGGRLAGGLMLERLRDRGRAAGGGVVLMIDHNGVTSTFQRCKGFGDVMRLRGGQFQVETTDAKGQTDFAREQVLAAIDKYGPKLAGIFCSNDGMTLGALEAVEEKGRLNDIVLFGYDYVKESQDAVDDGRLSGIVIQFPRKIGAAAFRIAYDYARGVNRRPPREKLVEVGTYMREGYFDQRGNSIPAP